MNKKPLIEKELTEISQQEIKLRNQLIFLRELRKGYILQLDKSGYPVPEIVRFCNIGGRSITRQAVYLIINAEKK